MPSQTMAFTCIGFCDTEFRKKCRVEMDCFSGEALLQSGLQWFGLHCAIKSRGGLMALIIGSTRNNGDIDGNTLLEVDLLYKLGKH
jgi:hypothetical protein